MTFSRPTQTALIDRVRGDINGWLAGADARLRRSILDTLARVHARATNDLYGMLADAALQIMPDTADTDHLDRWATIWLPDGRKGSTAAIGTVALTGVSGAILPIGAVLDRADGVSFVTTTLATIVDGVAAGVAIEASDGGAAGNTAAGIALNFASPSAGIGATATVEAAGLRGGSDEESDELLLGRLLARIRTPPHGGATADYIAWALAQPEVTRAWVYPGWTGVGSVGVGVVMDGRDDIFPTADDIAPIQAALDLERPVTAALTVFAPTPFPVDHAIRLVPDTAATRAAVAAELRDLYDREAQPGGTILISHEREAIAVALGVTDYDLVMPPATFTAPAGAMPTLGDISWITD